MDRIFIPFTANSRRWLILISVTVCILIAATLMLQLGSSQQDPHLVRTMETSSSGNTVIFSPDGEMLAVGENDGSISLWDVHTGKLIQSLLGHTKAVNGVAFSPDAQLLVSGSSDGTIRLWRISNGSVVYIESHPPPEQPIDYLDASSFLSVAFDPTGRLVAAGDGEGKVWFWTAEDGHVVRTVATPKEGYRRAILSVAFTSTGQL